MVAQSFKRKLTAMLIADVKGYSRLMGEDEVGTIRTLTAYKDEYLKLWPKTEGECSLEIVRNRMAKQNFYQNPAHLEQLVEGVRRAGLK